MNEDPVEEPALIPVGMTFEEIEYLSVLVAHDVRLDAAFSPQTAARHRPVLGKLQRALAPYQESSL